MKEKRVPNKIDNNINEKKPQNKQKLNKSTNNLLDWYSAIFTDKEHDLFQLEPPLHYHVS